jgi:hypothetical protein
MDTMSRLVENDPSGGGARVHQIARAREILVEHEKEFRRMKVSSLEFEGELIGSRQLSRREIERR